MDSERIVDLLPDVFRRAVVPDEAIDVLTTVMSRLHQPVEDVLDDFDAYLDPYRCPPEFASYLAHWVGLGWLLPDASVGATLPTGDGPLRDLIAHAEALAKMRGTALGLEWFLRLATGVGPYDVVEAEGRDDAFHIVVNGPAEARTARELIDRIVTHEKPAFTTAAVSLGDEPPRRLGRRWDDHRSNADTQPTPDAPLERPE